MSTLTTKQPKPRVLVYSGQPFNYSTGLGITLSNLFKGWPKNNIAGIFHEPFVPDMQVCEKYFKLEEHEKQWLFPMNTLRYSRNILRKRSKASDLNETIQCSAPQYQQHLPKSKAIFKRRLFRHTIHLRRFRLSASLRQWIYEYNPEILYCCVVSLADIAFVTYMANVFQVKLVIHMLDDWPNLVNNEPGYLTRLWGFLINKNLRILFKRADLLLGICDEMCRVYSQRYGLSFLPFHNCPDPDLWITYGRRKWNSKDVFSFVFTGAIYDDFNLESMREIASAICVVNRRNVIRCSLTIYSDSENALDLERCGCGSSSLQVKKVAMTNEGIARIFGLADVLLLPFDFSRRSVAASRLSFPTKIPTYMLSATPIFVYGPIECATVKYLKENDAAFIVDHHCSSESLADEIEKICGSSEVRRLIGGRARALAEKAMTAEVVRKPFQNALSSLVHR